MSRGLDKVLYHAVSSYQLLEVLLHRWLFHGEQGAALVLPDFIVEKYPQWQRLEGRGFFDQVALFPYLRIPHGEEGQVTAQVLSAYDAENTQGSLRPILTAVFRFILETRELFATILGGGEPLFFSRLQRLIYDMYLREWNGFYDLGSVSGTNYYLEFVVAGVVGLVRAWAQGGMAESAETMAALAEQMIVSGLPHRTDNAPQPDAARP